MTPEDIVQQKKDILFAHHEAIAERARLVQAAKNYGAQLRKVAVLLEAVEEAPDNPLQAEADLLMLQAGNYPLIDVATVKAVANAVAGSRKAVRETEEAKRRAGYLG